MTYTPPCRVEGADPNDWFIRPDGRQYPDDAYVTPAEYDAEVWRLEDEAEEVPEDLLEQMEAGVKKAAVTRRRHARDACWSDCATAVRTACLGIALENKSIMHGTFGGYYEEQIQELREAREERRRLRRSAEVD